MISRSNYKKYRGAELIKEEDESMDILWYYPYEMELMLEKTGFHSIKRMNRYVNGGDHISFICQA